MEQLQGLLCSSLQGYPKIIKDLKDQKLCSERTRCTRNAALFTNMQQDHTLELANLATATQADRTSVALLTKMISELSRQVVNTICLGLLKEKNTNMTPEEDNIFGAFSECPLGPLEDVSK